MRVTAVIASAIVAIVVAGCSASEDPGEGTTDDHLGESEAPLARFAPYLSTLRGTLESGQSNEAIATSLLSSGRSAAFSLQALCRVYGDADPKFKELRDDFKGLEDGIGQYDKWNTIYKAAVAQHRDDETLARLKGERDRALAAFTEMLTAKQWLKQGDQPSRLDQVQAFLNGFDWKTRRDDRKLVLKQLIHELEDIQETTYDMKILEVGNGVHELRRDIRWVLIEQLALNGMITAKEGACPIPAYASLPSDNRYGALRSSAVEPNPCQVDACLVYASAKTVSDLGDIKDQAETQVNIAGAEDVVPEALQAPAKAIYDGIVASDLVGKYVTELKACKDAL